MDLECLDSSGDDDDNDEEMMEQSQADQQITEVLLGSNDAKAVQRAIRNGADVNAVHRGGTKPLTPLYVACEFGYDEIVRILLVAGADPRWKRGRDGAYPRWKRGPDDRSPAEIACYNGHLSIIEILINHDNSLLGLSYEQDEDEDVDSGESLFLPPSVENRWTESDF